METGLTQNSFFGKSSQNSPKPVLIFFFSNVGLPCVFCLYNTFLTVFGYYDLSVLSMSVMVSKKVWMGSGWVGGLRPINFFWIF